MPRPLKQGYFYFVNTGSSGNVISILFQTGTNHLFGLSCKVAVIATGDVERDPEYVRFRRAVGLGV